MWLSIGAASDVWTRTTTAGSSRTGCLASTAAAATSVANPRRLSWQQAPRQTCSRLVRKCRRPTVSPPKLVAAGAAAGPTPAAAVAAAVVAAADPSVRLVMGTERGRAQHRRQQACVSEQPLQRILPLLLQVTAGCVHAARVADMPLHLHAQHTRGGTVAPDDTARPCFHFHRACAEAAPQQDHVASMPAASRQLH